MYAIVINRITSTSYLKGFSKYGHPRCVFNIEDAKQYKSQDSAKKTLERIREIHKADDKIISIDLEEISS